MADFQSLPERCKVYAKTLFLKKYLKNEEIRKIPFTDFPECLFDVRIFILSREKIFQNPIGDLVGGGAAGLLVRGARGHGFFR